jgi:hypothetical protein
MLLAIRKLTWLHPAAVLRATPARVQALEQRWGDWREGSVGATKECSSRVNSKTTLKPRNRSKVRRTIARWRHAMKARL